MFIVFEGVDFTGKTTLSKMLREKLAVMFPEKKVEWFRAPDGPIRDVLLNRDSEIDGETEVLLFTACHRWLISNKIKPVLDNGGIVVLDRFTDTTISYQGGGRGLGVNYVQKIIEEHVPAAYRPDHTIYTEATEEIREQRRGERTHLDFMDQQTIEFRRRVVKTMTELKLEHIAESVKNRETAMTVTTLPNNGPLQDTEHQLEYWLRYQLDTLLEAHERRALRTK